MTIAAIMKVTAKVAICLYVNKMLLTTAMAEYELEVAYSAPSIIMVTSTIRLDVKFSQSKVTTQSMEL